MRLLLLACLLSQGCLWALNDSRANTAYIQAMSLKSAQKRVEKIEEVLAVEVNNTPIKPIIAEIKQDLKVASVIAHTRMLDSGPPKEKVTRHRSDHAKSLMVRDVGLAAERSKRKKLVAEMAAALFKEIAGVVGVLVRELPWYIRWGIYAAIGGLLCALIGWATTWVRAMWKQKRQKQEGDELLADMMNSTGRVAASQEELQEEMLKHPHLQAAFKRAREAGLVYRTAETRPKYRASKEETNADIARRVREMNGEADTRCDTRENVLESAEEDNDVADR